MKFLLFNALVIGALFYLFNADRSDIASVADSAHAVVASAEDVAAKAVDQVDGFMHRDAEVEAEVPEYAVAPPPPSVAEPAPVVEKQVVVEEKATPMPPAIPESEETATPKPKRSRVAEQELPLQLIPERPRPTVDYAKAENVEEAESVAAGSSDGEITIAEGETLMTPRERRKELFALAEDMEMMFIKKLNR
ncbi:MAG: hypothetical protein HN403_11110 [Rhodospirillales bacterium]|jgi:hypothetical protein|nr:hypothetical protein [Rhodospirillales bacterium]